MDKLETTADLSVMTDSEYFFPKRKTFNTYGKKLNLASNFFKFGFIDSQNKAFFKYSVVFLPDIPGDSLKLRSSIIGKANKEIKSSLGNYLFNNSTLYAMKNVPDIIEISLTYLEQTYSISIKMTNSIDPNSLEALALYKKFFNTLVKQMNFIQIRRNLFDPSNSKNLNSQKLEVWPGFNSSVNIYLEGVLLNMNLVYRVLRPETALEMLSTLRSCDKKEICDKFKGMAILTRYNNDKTYIIDGVDFTKTPLSTFDTKEGPITYQKYYETKYKRKIVSLDQPLLVHIDKKKGQEIHLVPELCYLTGLTDEMRSNYTLMKDLAVITKGTAQEKMNECKNLIDSFTKNEKCMDIMKTWGMYIDKQPVTLTGVRATAGNYVMHKKQDGSRHNFPIDDCPDIDRKIQTEMYSQSPLDNWIIFCTEKDSQIAETFLETMRQVQGTYNYPMTKPMVVYIKTQHFKDWEFEISRTVNPNVKAVVLIIPGNRGKGQIYAEVKRLMLCKFPIPSQVVLSGTIAKGKGVRSIVNKILVQICAKTGGEPWTIDQLPMTGVPTMLCGLDLFTGTGKKSILGFTATYNKTFSKYISLAKVYEDSNSEILFDFFEEAIKNFASCNQIPPQHIVVIRDGVSPTRIKSVCLMEICKIKEALSKLEISGCKLTYILVNKKTSLKLFSLEQKGVFNTPPGTIVDSYITSGEINDFYLVSQKTTQGIPAAVHYQVVFDDFTANEKDIQLLMYKLCYLYYNWTGSIKVPAPCQYAHKLAYLLGDKLSDKKGVYLPNSRFSQHIKSLYYL